MAGNVMEWVNDWKGPYVPEGMRDFAGVPRPGPGPRIPVKGGAFNYGLAELRPANRLATYAAIPSSANEYVGFRCALARAARSRFLSPDGNPAATEPVAVWFQHRRAGLRGRRARSSCSSTPPGDGGNLAYVCFRFQPPVQREFSDFGEPVPSFHLAGRELGRLRDRPGRRGGRRRNPCAPPGRLEEAGPVKVGRRVHSRWWVDPVAQDTFLDLCHHRGGQSERALGSTRTPDAEVAGGQPVGDPVALTRDGGFHDGRSRDGRCLATGYRQLKMRDLEKGAETATLFTAPVNGKPDGDTSQVCNVSMAPDSCGKCCSWISDAGVSGVVGAPYGIHQYAFMAEPTGKVTRWFRRPRAKSPGTIWNGRTIRARRRVRHQRGRGAAEHLPARHRGFPVDGPGHRANLMQPAFRVAGGTDFATPTPSISTAWAGMTSRPRSRDRPCWPRRCTFSGAATGEATPSSWVAPRWPTASIPPGL